MSIYYESYGNFTTEISSYWALTSKKSRGTLKLTEKSFSFKSEKDKIMYDIKTSTILNFYLKKTFRFICIELITNQGIYYNFYPHKQQNESLPISIKLIRQLFNELVRVVYKSNYPILFEARGSLVKRLNNKANSQENRLSGILLLTEEYLQFKSYKEEPIIKIPILNTEDITLNNNSSDNFIQIKTIDAMIFSIEVLKKEYTRKRKDKLKSKQLYEMLIQLKEYKISEMIQKRQEEENRFKQLKSIFEVSNKVKLDMIQTALDMNDKDFTNKIFEWAKKFKFIIDGEFLIVNMDTISEFIHNLKLGFDLSIRRDLRISCSNCGKNIEYTAKICPFCGEEQDLALA